MLTSAGAAASSCRPFRFPALRPVLLEDHVNICGLAQLNFEKICFGGRSWEIFVGAL